MAKKIFAISTLVLVLLVGVIFVYNFVFKKPSASQGDNKTQVASEEGKKPSVEDLGSESTGDTSLKAISEEPVFGATLSPSGNGLYLFLGSNGQLNQVNPDGKLDKVLSDRKFENIKKAIWNKSKKQAIIETEEADEASPRFFFFDLESGTSTELKKDTDSVAWSNLGDKIIYKFYDSKKKERSINISDPDGSSWTQLAVTNFFGLEIVAVPGTSSVSFWPSPSAFTPTSVEIVSFSGEEKKGILKGRYGVSLLWSPDGKWAAVSYSDQKGGHKTDLATMNSQGGQFQSLGFPTFSSKCAWSHDSKYLFCALPGNIPGSAILPDDWQEGKVQTADTFWKIEVSNGKKERLIDAEKISSPIDALNLFLGKDSQSLFFINKRDGKLYRLNF